MDLECDGHQYRIIWNLGGSSSHSWNSIHGSCCHLIFLGMCHKSFHLVKTPSILKYNDNCYPNKITLVSKFIVKIEFLLKEEDKSANWYFLYSEPFGKTCQIPYSIMLAYIYAFIIRLICLPIVRTASLRSVVNMFILPSSPILKISGLLQMIPVHDALPQEWS